MISCPLPHLTIPPEDAKPPRPTSDTLRHSLRRQSSVLGALIPARGVRGDGPSAPRLSRADPRPRPHTHAKPADLAVRPPRERGEHGRAYRQPIATDDRNRQIRGQPRGDRRSSDWANRRARSRLSHSRRIRTWVGSRASRKSRTSWHPWARRTRRRPRLPGRVIGHSVPDEQRWHRRLPRFSRFASSRWRQVPVPAATIVIDAARVSGSGHSHTDWRHGYAVDRLSRHWWRRRARGSETPLIRGMSQQAPPT